MQQAKETISIFISYAHKDEKLMRELEKQLSTLKRQNLISTWNNCDISAGQNWQQVVDQHLSTSKIILLLISPDFIASDYCYSIEMEQAIKQHNRGEAHIIPVILRPVDWKNTPFSKLQALPRNKKAITLWTNRDAAFLEVTADIRELVEQYFLTKEQISLSYNTHSPYQTRFSTNQINTMSTYRQVVYKKWLLVFLIVSYVTGLIPMITYSALVDNATSSTSVSQATSLFFTTLSSIGTLLLFIVVVIILIKDWHGVTTLRGRINWQRFSGKGRFWIACLYVFLLMFIIGIYLVLTALSQKNQNNTNIV